MSDQSRKRLTTPEMARRVRHAQLSQLLREQSFRDWALWFFGQAGILTQSARADVHGTFFAEGRRSLGIEVLTEFCAADPTAAQLMFPDATTLMRVLGTPARSITPGDDDGRRSSYDSDGHHGGDDAGD